MRSREQIIEDCSKELDRLRQQAELRETDPRYTHPCTSCRFYVGTDGVFDHKSRQCHEPLVKGFRLPHFMYHSLKGPWRGWEDDQGQTWAFPTLCGKEKALWQPRLSLWQKIVKLLTEGVNT